MSLEQGEPEHKQTKRRAMSNAGGSWPPLIVTDVAHVLVKRFYLEAGNEVTSSPDMPILRSSNSVANKDIMSKYRQIGIQLSD